MTSIVPSLVALGIAALIALVLALRVRSAGDRPILRQAAARTLLVATGVQAVHLAEETLTGFHERFPAMFGLEPMPLLLFLGFNVGWLAAWAASIPGLRSRATAAYFAAWFLAIAGSLNGVAHPALAIAAGGYFPGLITSPAIGFAGILLAGRLRAASRPA